MAKQQDLSVVAQEVVAQKYEDLSINDSVVISKKQLENVSNEDEDGFKMEEKEVQIVVTKFFWESVEVNDKGYSPTIRGRLIGVPIFGESGELVDVIKF